jgi:hypothetical protein
MCVRMYVCVTPLYAFYTSRMQPRLLSPRSNTTHTRIRTKFTHAHPNSHSLSLSLSHTHISLSYIHTFLSLTHTHTHTHTHTDLGDDDRIRLWTWDGKLVCVRRDVMQAVASEGNGKSAGEEGVLSENRIFSLP